MRLESGARWTCSHRRWLLGRGERFGPSFVPVYVPVDYRRLVIDLLRNFRPRRCVPVSGPIRIR